MAMVTKHTQPRTKREKKRFEYNHNREIYRYGCVLCILYILYIPPQPTLHTLYCHRDENNAAKHRKASVVTQISYVPNMKIYHIYSIHIYIHVCGERGEERGYKVSEKKVKWKYYRQNQSFESNKNVSILQDNFISTQFVTSFLLLSVSFGSLHLVFVIVGVYVYYTFCYEPPPAKHIPR